MKNVASLLTAVTRCALEQDMKTWAEVVKTTSGTVN